MSEFSKIYLAWRKGSGSRRHIVGLLEKDNDNNVTFKYLPEAKALRNKEGFIPYFEFQNLDKIYDVNVLSIFSHRLIKTDRPDVKNFLDFWEVNPDKADDKFYLLGKTQGLTATDNFEFLAEYHTTTDLHFLTDISGLSYAQIPRNFVKNGDLLQYALEKDNEHDKEAVIVTFNGTKLGYIKRIHCRVFQEAPNLLLSVKAIEQNGVIRKIFIKVSN